TPRTPAASGSQTPPRRPTPPPQPAHAAGSTRCDSVGSLTCRRVTPGSPGCLPGLRPDRPRSADRFGFAACCKGCPTKADETSSTSSTPDGAEAPGCRHATARPRQPALQAHRFAWLAAQPAPQDPRRTAVAWTPDNPPET